MNIRPIKIDHANPPPEGTRGLWWFRELGFWQKGAFTSGYVIPSGAGHLAGSLSSYSHYIPDFPPPDDPRWEER